MKLSYLDGIYQEKVPMSQFNFLQLQSIFSIQRFTVKCKQKKIHVANDMQFVDKKGKILALKYASNNCQTQSPVSDMTSQKRLF